MCNTILIHRIKIPVKLETITLSVLIYWYMSNTMYVVEKQFLKHEKFQTFFYDYAIASE